MNQLRIIDERKTITGDEHLGLAEAKEWLRVTFTDDDTIITALIKSVRASIEDYCSISIVEKEIIVEVELAQPNNRDNARFELPYGPVSGNIEVSYQDGYKSTDWATKELDEDYYIDGLDYPSISSFVCGRYRLSYDAGFADGQCPDQLIHAMKVELAERYERRGDAADQRKISESARKIAQPFKRMIWVM